MLTIKTEEAGTAKSEVINIDSVNVKNDDANGQAGLAANIVPIASENIKIPSKSAQSESSKATAQAPFRNIPAKNEQKPQNLQREAALNVIDVALLLIAVLIAFLFYKIM